MQGADYKSPHSRKTKTKRLLPIEWFINSISKHDKHQFQSERHHIHFTSKIPYPIDSPSQPPTLEKFIRKWRLLSLRTKNGLLHQNIFLHINRIFFLFVSHNKRSTLQQNDFQFGTEGKIGKIGPHIKIANKKNSRIANLSNWVSGLFEGLRTIF